MRSGEGFTMVSSWSSSSVDEEHKEEVEGLFRDGPVRLYGVVSELGDEDVELLVAADNDWSSVTAWV